jgi:hypothetical protein
VGQRQLPFIKINTTKICAFSANQSAFSELLPPEVDVVKDYALAAFGLPGLIISLISQMGGLLG